MVMGFRVGATFRRAARTMTYTVSLKITAFIIGLLCIAGHLPLALAPARLTPLLRSLPRNYPLGAVLMAAATLWFATLTGLMDLGEISSIRTQLVAVWAISGLLVIIFVPGFLAARGLGCLLLLGAAGRARRLFSGGDALALRAHAAGLLVGDRRDGAGLQSA